ncbi:Fanconi-associated nuclease 1-like protein [Thalictrum thalictroides]|uniref:Fanconi-associated nuclease n=1 Tax=Thalictrum thalictroides TaxID=46969 RepID=A0A7J6WS35_THATH|nr:Fanconi-associated nuclease 1-like protein [Thalictrum thalictroides]
MMLLYLSPNKDPTHHLIQLQASPNLSRTTSNQTGNKPVDGNPAFAALIWRECDKLQKWGKREEARASMVLTMLKGKESLIRLVGKRRRILPNRQSLFSTNPESLLSVIKEDNGEGSSKHQIVDLGPQIGEEEEEEKKEAHKVDWVTCPVCGKAVRGDDYMINSHLDVCLSRGTKRKLTQRTLLQFSFSPKSKESTDVGRLNNIKSNVSPSISDHNYSQRTRCRLPEVDGPRPLSSINTLEKCEEASETLLRKDFVNDKEKEIDVFLSKCTMPKLDTCSTSDKSVEVLETYIVGRKFSDEVEFKQGNAISLSRDPNNSKDPNAIKVLFMDSGCMKVLGFLPRELAKYLSPLIEKYNLKLEGSVLSLPKHPLDAVPVKIVCQEIPSFEEKEYNHRKVFESLWKSVQSVIEYNKSFPPSIARYQQNFCLLLHEVMRNHHHLFTDDENVYIESFRALSDDSQRLFIRLYTRKGPWFRMSSVSYPEIVEYQHAIKELCGAGYICSFEFTKFNGCELQDVLDMLNVSELRELMRQLHVKMDLLKYLCIFFPLKSSKIHKDSTRKQELVASLLASYEDGICPSLPSLVLDRTGTCVRISPTAEFLLWRVQRLFFLNGDQDLSAFLLVDLGLVKYPTYNCKISNHIFPGRSDLLAYEEAIEVAQVMDESVDENNNEMVIRCVEISDGRISNYPGNVILPSSPNSAGTFLSFFSASWVYSKVVTLGISFLEHERRYKDAIRLLKHLLGAITSDGRRGYWTLRLSVDLEHVGHVDESLSVAEEGLSDPWVRAGSRMALQRRVLRLGRPPRRWKLPSFAESIKRKIKEVHVLGRPLNCDMGMKNRFYGNDGEQCGVEELALQYYAEEGGGWQGVHTESGIWMTIFGLLMWDIIFTDVPDVFPTRFQTAPLDLETDNFYIARKSLIESHLQKIHSGLAEEILVTTWESHVGTSCRGVNWDRHSLSDLRAAVTCVGGTCLASLCRLLAQDYRSWSRGMPDLFLWRFIGDYTGEAKLVEVKGPRDRLSEQQRAWLMVLMDSKPALRPKLRLALDARLPQMLEENTAFVVLTFRWNAQLKTKIIEVNVGRTFEKFDVSDYFWKLQEMGSNDNATTAPSSKPFSIRKYVFEARDQDISHNWPFCEKHLQVCVKHGINRLLPPFDSRDSEIYNSFKEHIQSSCADEENAHIGSNNNSFLETSRQKQLDQVVSPVCMDEAVSEITKQMSPLSVSKKTNKHDDSGVSSDIALHPIDMEVPTSTLKANFNYHTDQCLSELPSTKSLSKIRRKHKGKHKKRSIVEIYAEASPCTLEDLPKM